MYARFVMIAAAAAVGTSALAEPVNAPVRETSQSANRPAEVMLASADQVRTPTPTADQPATTPAKPKRVARVTTCRCGDPQQQ